MMPMQSIAHFSGGPHDGAECEINAPFPLKLTLHLEGIVADYHYHGFKDGSAFYGFERVGVLHSSAA